VNFLAKTQPSRARAGFILVLLLLVLLWHKPILRIYFVLDYPDKIITYSRANGMNPSTVSAIVFTESRFNTAACSHKGALGLMQIMPSTGEWVARQLDWKSFSKNDLLIPEKNLAVGIWYLAYLKRNFNQNEYLALASYNAGSRHVSQWLKDGVWDGDRIKIEQIPFPETKKYIIRILVLRKIYSYLYPDLLTT
jgi:Soluble lytic murein transglycosylase and related regulatory proteins (some contain LysM/invasin domains)